MLYILALCLLCIHQSEGLYFHMKETEQRCFIEDLADDTLVSASYKLLASKDKHFERTKEVAVHVKVTDPDDHLILDRSYSSEGRFVFTGTRPGDYRICLSTNSSVWFGGSSLRVYLDIQTGEHAINYQEVASKEKLDDLQLRVRQLFDQVQAIAKDQNYQRVREVHFRDLSESTNKRVTWWSVGQLTLLVVIGFWQMRHLRSFFQAKKLV